MRATAFSVSTFKADKSQLTVRVAVSKSWRCDECHSATMLIFVKKVAKRVMSPYDDDMFGIFMTVTLLSFAFMLANPDEPTEPKR